MNDRGERFNSPNERHPGSEPPAGANRTNKTFSIMTHATISSPRVYVGTYGKYNAGSLAGAWLDLSKFKDFDAFMNECRRVHKDERDPEFMIQDVECWPDGFSAPECISREEFDDVMTAWRESAEEAERPETPGERLELVEYSEKAVAVIGDTKDHKEQLKAMGGRFNARLTCGPGWVFSRRKEAELREFIAGTAKAGELPGRTTRTNEANDPGAKYREGLEKFNRATGYEWKCRQGAIDLGGYFYLLPDKASIQGSFWFHDEGPNYDYYLEVTANEETKRDYFIKKNLHQFDVDEAREDLDRYGVYEYEQDGQKVIDIARYGTMPEARPATDAEKAAILGALAWCREKFEKRLDAYLKRWGTSKLRFGTYWADR